MRTLFRAVRAPYQKKRLYLFALWIVLVKRIQLTLWGRQVAQRASKPEIGTIGANTSGEIALAISRVAKIVPRASCLTQALAAQTLLLRHGHIPTVQIGVRSDQNKTLAAHAWVICNGDIILGGTKKEIATYQLLTELDGSK